VQPLDDGGIRLELLDRRSQGGPALGRVEVPRELEHGRILEGRVAVQISARREHEEGAANGGVAVAGVEWNLPSRDVGLDDQLGVVSRRRQAAYSSAIASASSRIPIPSSISSRVMVSGGHTMITFQCVIR
jgi:hypothetical protein